MFSLKSYYLYITNKEITQIPKSETKKFSVLCTFKIKLDFFQNKNKNTIKFKSEEIVYIEEKRKKII